MKINRFHLEGVQNFVGFSLNTAGGGETVKVLTRAALTSDENYFYTFIDQISEIFFSKIRVSINSVHRLLILIHNDLSADIYINEFPLLINVLSIRAMQKGEVVTQKDIADIKEVRFGHIEIKDTDKVIFCGKIGWKFLLFFDLNRTEKLKVDEMWIILGDLYRYLSFQYIYKLLESDKEFSEMVKDGWFPFIELIGGAEYKILSTAYKNKRFLKDNVESIVNKFDGGRIDKITSRWWHKKVFYEKKAILMAGINAFLRADDEGYITSIKTLLPEIEGIIRLQYFSDTNKSNNVKIRDLLKYITDKGKNKFGSDLSLLFPLPFFDYLNDVIFVNFDIKGGNVKLSRHSSSHGVAKADDYTKIKALQMILILDQLSFYI